MIGNLLPGGTMHGDIGPGSRRCRKVEDIGRFFAAWPGKGYRIGSQHALRATEWRHPGMGGIHGQANEAGLCYAFDHWPYRGGMEPVVHRKESDAHLSGVFDELRNAPLGSKA